LSLTALGIQSQSTVRRRSVQDCSLTVQPIHFTGAVDAASQKAETGWLLAQALRQ
jgi:hypothetical protein